MGLIATVGTLVAVAFKRRQNAADEGELRQVAWSAFVAWCAYVAVPAYVHAFCCAR